MRNRGCQIIGRFFLLIQRWESMCKMVPENTNPKLRYLDLLSYGLPFASLSSWNTNKSKPYSTSPATINKLPASCSKLAFFVAIINSLWLAFSCNIFLLRLSRESVSDCAKHIPGTSNNRTTIDFMAR